MQRKHTADVVIVGSGIAGALCAYQLAKHGIDVLLLEAGPAVDKSEVVTNFVGSANFDYSSGYPNEQWAPRPDNDGYIHYLKSDFHYGIEYLSQIGGTTLHWGATAMRLLPSDFEMHTRYGVGKDWSISYADLEAYYSMAEYEIGVAGDDKQDYGSPRSRQYPMPPIVASYGESLIADVLSAKMGMSFIASPMARNSVEYDGRSVCQGYSTCVPVCPIGAKYDASVHVKKAEELGVKLINNARVGKLITDKFNRISHLNYQTMDGNEVVVEAKQFILAANAIETPKLLLMSASEENSSGLANSSGLVGKNFYGHVGISAQMTLPYPVYLGRGPAHTMHCFDYRDGDFRKDFPAFHLAVDNSNPMPRVHQATIEAVEKGLLGEQVNEFVENRVIHNAELVCMMEQLPDSDNQISLDYERKDSSGQPGINLKWGLDNYVDAGAKQAKKLLEEAAQHLHAQDLSFKYPLQHHHPMGTTIMGMDADSSVVDSNCQTHDHENLFIAGSAVFPAGGNANPTLTIAALSLRIADYIRKTRF